MTSFLMFRSKLCNLLMNSSRLFPEFGNELFSHKKNRWTWTNQRQFLVITSVHDLKSGHSQNQVTKRYVSRQSKDQLTKTHNRTVGEVTVKEKVAQAGKDVTYSGIIIIGIAVTSVLFYYIGQELFSGQSPSGVYGRALKLCKQNSEIQSYLGSPIKGYGETTRRGRRRHVSHQEYIQDDVKIMRIKFYIEGPQNKGDVYLEVKQNDHGKYEFRYIFVELQEYPRKTILVEDNR